VGGSDSEEVPQLQRYHVNYYNMQSKRWLMVCFSSQGNWRFLWI